MLNQDWRIYILDVFSIYIPRSCNFLSISCCFKMATQSRKKFIPYQRHRRSTSNWIIRPSIRSQKFPFSLFLFFLLSFFFFFLFPFLFSLFPFLLLLCLKTNIMEFRFRLLPCCHCFGDIFSGSKFCSYFFFPTFCTFFWGLFIYFLLF